MTLMREMMSRHQREVAEVSYLDAEQLANFLGLSIENTFAVVTIGGVDRFFRQQRGLAMGKSFVPACANLWMGWWEEDLEREAERAGGEVVFACRYVDDYLVGWKGGQAAMENWLAALNAKDAAINLTHEVEKEGWLSYLDISIQRTLCNMTQAQGRPTTPRPRNLLHAMPNLT